jgi:hypothetical protein
MALATAAIGAQAQSPQTCSAHSAVTVTPLVELYTSEGCSSCPPADRWLSRLKGRDDVVAVAFHVQYWDYLGWRDRFASTAFTQRQAQQRAVNAAPYSYTPQVVVDGHDRPDWPRIAALPASRATSPVTISLQADGTSFVASVASVAGAPAQLAGWWAVTEDGHASAVNAGENSGTTLHHDFVVREQRPVAAWIAHSGTALRLVFEPALARDARHPRHVVLVVTDAATGRPLQAVQLGC